jgi:hypothetical protein
MRILGGGSSKSRGWKRRIPHFGFGGWKRLFHRRMLKTQFRKLMYDLGNYLMDFHGTLYCQHSCNA